MQHRWIMALAAIPFTFGLGGCASSPPSELKEARTAYRHAADGPAAVEAPEELADAHKALKAAEKSFDDDGASRATKEKALDAQAKSQFAIELADQRIQAKKDQPKEVEATVALPDKEPPKVQAEADQGFFESLRQLATVSQGADGSITSLSSDFPFDSGSAELGAGMREKLEVIASALKDRSTGPITITGHCDADGGEEMNEALSLARANAVKDALASLGVPEDRMTVRGLGETAPVASNDSEEGRAQNRRVQIALGAI